MLSEVCHDAAILNKPLKSGKRRVSIPVVLSVTLKGSVLDGYTVELRYDSQESRLVSIDAESNEEALQYILTEYGFGPDLVEDQTLG
jgi:hypothetical protein